MKKIQKSIFLAIILIFGTATISQNTICAQNNKSISWSIVTIDSTWNPKEVMNTGKIIAKYKPSIDPLMAVIGQTDKELDKYTPESPLSNLSADIILQAAQKYINGKVDIALTNFGGIRTSIPKGDISAFDILSVFPFNNKIVVLDIEGKYVRELMENFAKRGRVEAVSGVEIVINKKVLEKCLIGGAPIDDNKIYKLASIDFLLTGGDSVYALKYASSVIETGIILRDAVIEYIKKVADSGKKINAEKDGRVVIIK